MKFAIEVSSIEGELGWEKKNPNIIEVNWIYTVNKENV